MSPAEYLKMPYGRVVVPETNGTFRGEIIEFPGCISAGDTAEEALANLERVAEGWLEATLARGQHVPEPIENQGFSGKLVVRLPKTLHKKATHAAAREGVSLNQFIANSVAEQVGVCSSRGHRYWSSSGTSVAQHGVFTTYTTTELHGASVFVGTSGPGFSRLPFDDNRMIDFPMESPGWSHAGS